MKNVGYSEFRANLSKFIDDVNLSSTPIKITRKSGLADAVLISTEDYMVISETAYLASSETNKQNLIQSLDELESNGGIESGIIRK